jgi:L-alanine-DL-glutamate epimerase-like enolase superfamily enzyme
LKITDITMTDPLYLPPFPGLLHQGDARWGSTGPQMRSASFLRVHTDEGITGISPGSLSPSIRSFVFDVFKPLVVGEDPFQVEKIWEKCYWTQLGSARRGAPMRALSSIDIAIWDIIGKACKQPIHRLLGGHRTKVAAYGSYFNLPYSLDQLIKQNQMYVDMGFKMVKMKIGQKDMREDLRRIKAVRDTVGDDVDIAVDANNMYGVNTAISMARRMERYEIYWFEEPVFIDNLDGIVKLAKSTSIPIAGYELENTKYGFKELIARGAIDICQADATICGGITEWRKIAALAECYGMPVAPHGMDQLHVPLVAAIPNGLIIEWMYALGARTAEVVENPILPKDGMMECKTVPGLGLEISDETFKKYSTPVESPIPTVRKVNPRYQWPPYA